LATLDEPVKAEPPTERVEVGRQQARTESRLGVLTILQGEKAGISYNLDMDRARIGRAEENDLVLADPRASRFHAEIKRAPSGYIIRDLGSTNGTMVRGRKVQERLLEDGDTLVVGGTEMRFGLINDPRYR
jgi:predicted component of type VI protein secretion system